MKIVLLLCPLLFYVTSFAAAPTTSQALKRALKANPAIQGAVLEAKHYAGAASCGPIQILNFDGDSFRAVIDCTKPDSKKSTVIGDGATGQVEVSGSIYNGGSGVLIERIEFHYAG